MTEQGVEKSLKNKGQAASRDRPVVSPEHERIVQWLAKVHFRKRLLGGVVERDVWKKIGELDTLYSQALYAERVRYDLLLEQQRQSTPQPLAATDEQKERG